MSQIAVLGAGVMGTSLAIHLGRNEVPVNLWGTKWDDKVLNKIDKDRYHDALDVAVPENIKTFRHNKLKDALDGVDVIVIAVLSHGVEDISREMSPYLQRGQVIVNISKGVQENTLRTMSQVIYHALDDQINDYVSLVKLGGPVIASELAHGKYTEAIFASKDLMAAILSKTLFESDTFKANVTEDIDGVEISASFKNSYAIMMGIMSGLEAGTNNSRAAIMARGSIEMANIVAAFGGQHSTAMGIAGVGDYYVTSQGGRNGIFGKYIGEGKTTKEALELMNDQTVEGIAATKNGYQLLKSLEAQRKVNIAKETPLFNQLYQILFENKPAEEALADYWKGR